MKFWKSGPYSTNKTTKYTRAVYWQLYFMVQNAGK
jgi:hypothetical protein